MALSAGTRLGPYQVVDQLGAGGMGEVYRARDTRLHRSVAIKIMPRHLAMNPELRQRFEREARAASSINHPHICTLYDVGYENDTHFLVMECLEGETLADRLRSGPLQPDETVKIATDIADALVEAHRHGLIHRDIKPANIFLTTRGDAKILDFGLAKINPSTEPSPFADSVTETENFTAVGTAVGTIAYMSPEQMQSLPLDHRTDLFSFGIVLYEMVSGKRPFPGSSPIAIADAILHNDPRDFGEEQVPTRLKHLVHKLLEKEPAKRYRSAREVLIELQELEASSAPVKRTMLSKTAWTVVVAVFLLVLSLAARQWYKSSQERWALQTAVPQISQFLDEGKYVQAAELIEQALGVLPNDPTLEELWKGATGEVSVSSSPAGADVSIRLYRSDPNSWEGIGKTPLQNVRVPRDAYVWRVAKPGYVTAYVIGRPPGEAAVGYNPPFELTWNLRPEGSVPPEMAVVSGGKVGLGPPYNQAPRVLVDDFLIDRHEVTNREYKKFVEAGGYQKPEFWKQPFVKDGQAMAWEEAIALFHDATGRPGPATWEVGDYPKGQEDYPVAGVSWHEAAAYAEFVRKSLPTVYHWRQASQAAQGIRANGLVELSTGFPALIATGSNFRGSGPRPVGSEGTLSGFGTTDMAGNVKEWCWNETRDGKRFLLGGSFGEPEYQFNHTDSQSPWDRRANFGFRCAKLDAPPSPTTVARVDVIIRDYWSEKPMPDSAVDIYITQYAYDKTALNALVEESVATQDGVRERVTFDTAYGQRMGAHLFLPKEISQPFQPVVFFPGAGAFLSSEIELSAIEDQLDFLLKSGRALVIPVFKGSWDRQDDYRSGGQPPGMFRDHVIAWGKDLGRTLDYLETRNEIDATRVAFFGVSLGGAEAPILAAVEERIKVVIISSGGFQLRRDLPEVDPFNFAPRVRVPVLMLGGRFDATFPLESSQRPLFHFLGTPEKDKKLVIYDEGHGTFPRPGAVRECLDWLDKYLGPVRR